MAAARPRLLKLSGEALGGDQDIFNPLEVARVCTEIVQATQATQAVAAQGPLAVVVGGGNIIRGASLKRGALDPTRGDYMGMLATLINALAVKDGIERAGGRAEIMAPQAIMNVALVYDRARALAYLQEGVVVIFGGGTGHPFFTTDTAAALRAAEINASEVLKGSKVDGIYNADPKLDAKARRFTHLSFQQALDGRYGVMDLAAFELCKERGISIRVFDMTVPGAIIAALGAHPPGTVVGAHPG